MDLRCLKTFLYVAELNSFTRAGQVLGYSQSTVSFQIRQLEAELDVRLFERINHTVTLTDKGREVLDYAHRITRLAQELDRSLREEKQVTGHVRLAMADSLYPVFFGGNYRGFCEKYPGITLSLRTAGTEEMFRLLDHNETDLVFTLDNHIYQAEYTIVEEKQVGVHFVAAAGHPLAGAGRLLVRQLLDCPFLLTERGMSYRRLLDEALAARSLEIVPKLELGNTEQLGRLAEQGNSLAFLPDYATEQAVRQGRLVRLPVEDVEIEVWLQLLCHRDKWRSQAMRAVMEYCRQAAF